MVAREGRIILIEDDEGMREAIESLLVAAGRVTTTHACAEALLVAESPADACCIVSDVMLPAMSGLELVSELRRRGQCLPVILITAHDSPAIRGEAVRCGAAAYLAKPFAGSALLDAIDRVSR